MAEQPREGVCFIYAINHQKVRLKLSWAAYGCSVMRAVYRFFFNPTQSRFSILAAERIITLQEFKWMLSSFQTTIPSDFYLKQRLGVSLWGFWSTGSVWSSPCLGFVFVTLTQLEWSGRRNLIWKNTSTRLSWKQVFKAFSWLVVGMRVISTLKAVPPLGRWWWE